MRRSIHVVQFQRSAGHFSVERMFEDVRAALPEDVEITLHINRHPSRGLFGRLADALEARRRRGTLNHVLGDVHYLAWFLPRRGTLLTVLDCVSLERMRGLRLRLFWFLWYWLPLRHAERITVISRFTRDSLLEWVDYPPERVHVIPPSLSAEFTASPLPLRGQHLRLLQVGTDQNKNLSRVIQAVRSLPVTLVIVGQLNNQQRQDLSRFGVPYENHFDLSREQLVDQYRSADALVMVSTYEGFGMPIIEAQAIGRPVVTSNVCSMPDTAGLGACLVDPQDVADIRRAIQRLIEDPTYCAALVTLGFANAARYTQQEVADQYADIYRRMSHERGH